MLITLASLVVIQYKNDFVVFSHCSVTQISFEICDFKTPFEKNCKFGFEVCYHPFRQCLPKAYFFTIIVCRCHI